MLVSTVGRSARRAVLTPVGLFASVPDASMFGVPHNVHAKILPPNMMVLRSGIWGACHDKVSGIRSVPLQAKGVLPHEDLVRPEPIRLVNWADVIRGVWSSENANRLAACSV